MNSFKRDFQNRLNLFIVDRDEVSLLLHRKVAISTGFFRSIRSATTGLNAFDQMNMAIEGDIPFPDVILFDLDLPVMNGITLLKVLRALKVGRLDNICFIVLASSISEREREAARLLGVSAFLSKPLSEESFIYAVSSNYCCPHQIDE